MPSRKSSNSSGPPAKRGRPKSLLNASNEPKECCIISKKIYLLKNLVLCSICLQILKEPKTLPCQHAFCSHCLKKLIRNSNLCPECRRSFEIPSNGVAGLPENIIIQSLLDIFKTDVDVIVNSHFRPRATSEAADDSPKIVNEQPSNSLPLKKIESPKSCKVLLKEKEEEKSKTFNTDELAEYLFYRIRGFSNPIKLVESSPGALTFHQELLNIFVLNTKKPEIHVLDIDNSHLYIHKVSVPGVRKREMKLVSIALSPKENRIYVTDENQRCAYELDGEGSFVRVIGKGTLRTPCGIAVDNDRYVYIVDSTNPNILVFDKNGTYRFKLICNEDNTALKMPTAMTVGNDSVVVCDQGDNTVRVFTSIGDLKFILSTFGCDRKLLGRPLAVALDKRGYIFVADDPEASCQITRIHIFTPDGQYIRTFRKFGQVTGIAVNTDGRLAIGDATALCISIY